MNNNTPDSHTYTLTTRGGSAGGCLLVDEEELELFGISALALVGAAIGFPKAISAYSSSSLAAFGRVGCGCEDETRFGRGTSRG